MQLIKMLFAFFTFFFYFKDVVDRLAPPHIMASAC